VLRGLRLDAVAAAAALAQGLLEAAAPSLCFQAGHAAPRAAGGGSGGARAAPFGAAGGVRRRRRGARLLTPRTAAAASDAFSFNNALFAGRGSGSGRVRAARGPSPPRHRPALVSLCPRRLVGGAARARALRPPTQSPGPAGACACSPQAAAPPPPAPRPSAVVCSAAPPSLAPADPPTLHLAAYFPGGPHAPVRAGGRAHCEPPLARRRPGAPPVASHASSGASDDEPPARARCGWSGRRCLRVPHRQPPSPGSSGHTAAAPRNDHPQSPQRALKSPTQASVTQGG